ncbi:doublecortin domain-containing protein 2B isoform X2 [Salarias fasciatus]|uniref:doublecortin domain-containing protein 2B isoform X2 n=1 Tax=Salarias fasciatus TaxID=181472 RepID=UPI001176EF02|nr:doublecortin domain-containing protein 2-like isoform X2 [Salarias fasciatus]
MAASSLLPPVKSVVVYRNGDPFHTGRRFVVNHRHVGTMEAFLNEVTHSIGATLAIRTLYTPRQGHRVADLQDLQTGAQYVAAGFERFKKLDYLNTGNKKLPTCEELKAKAVKRPADSSARWRHFVPVPCIIHVFRNGDLLHPPLRFIIPRSMQQDLDQVLRLVSEKVDLRTGAVRRLCSVGGQSVSSAADLQTGQCYVAVGTERFKKLPYVELLVSKTTQRYFPGRRRPRRLQVSLYFRTRAVREKPTALCFQKGGSGPEDQCSDSALLHSPQSDDRRVKSTGDETAEASERSTGGAESSLFPLKPVKISRNPTRKAVRSRSDQKNVFERTAGKTREEVRGAEEVQEDENTATELPLDQRVAEIIQDEELITSDELLRHRQEEDSGASSSAQQ